MIKPINQQAYRGDPRPSRRRGGGMWRDRGAPGLAIDRDEPGRVRAALVGLLLLTAALLAARAAVAVPSPTSSIAAAEQ